MNDSTVAVTQPDCSATLFRRCARAVSLADALDAMLTDRPYRKGLPLAVATAELERCSGSQFDPEYTRIFLDLLASGRLLPLRSNAA